MIEELSENTADDEKFCEKEHDLVQDYCYERNFQLTKEELETVCSHGYEESLECWLDYEGMRIGYQVVRDYHGIPLPVGNGEIFPEEEIAERYRKNMQKKPWMHDQLYLKKIAYEGNAPKERREYHGKKVWNAEWLPVLDVLNIGDLVEEGIVSNLLNAMPLVCCETSCTQSGEPAAHKMDGVCSRPVYLTFKKIAEDTWEYCGRCFRGENTERGTDIPVC